MTVGELITELMKYSPHFPVYGSKYGFCGYAENGKVENVQLSHKHKWDGSEFPDLEVGDPYVWIMMED